MGLKICHLCKSAAQTPTTHFTRKLDLNKSYPNAAFDTISATHCLDATFVYSKIYLVHFCLIFVFIFLLNNMDEHFLSQITSFTRFCCWCIVVRGQVFLSIVFSAWHIHMMSSDGKHWTSWEHGAKILLMSAVQIVFYRFAVSAFVCTRTYSCEPVFVDRVMLTQ